MWTIGINVSITQFVKPPPYLFTNLQVALLYIAPIIGCILAEIWGHFFNDWITRVFVKKEDGIWRPENRHWGAYPATAVSVAGLVLLGQTLQHQLSWLGIAFGWGMNTFGLLVSATVIAAYVLDTFPDHASLASSWINFWRTTGKTLRSLHPFSSPGQSSQSLTTTAPQHKGGFCVSYFQIKWVARNGPAVTFGIQAATVAAGVLAIVATQVWGSRWRRRFPVPEAEN